jgi:hypothetical protein
MLDRCKSNSVIGVTIARLPDTRKALGVGSLTTGLPKPTTRAVTKEPAQKQFVLPVRTGQCPNRSRLQRQYGDNGRRRYWTLAKDKSANQ